eukprot:1259937-Pyramimonas_sp.AAC.1
MGRLAQASREACARPMSPPICQPFIPFGLPSGDFVLGSSPRVDVITTDLRYADQTRNLVQERVSR